MIPIERDRSAEEVTRYDGRRTEDRTAHLLPKAQMEGDVVLEGGRPRPSHAITELNIEGSIRQDPSELLE